MPDNRVDSLASFLKAGIGKLLRDMIKSDPLRKKHGYLPKMATASKGSIGTWIASSLRKRVNSVANQAVTKGNSCLLPGEAHMLETLWMSRDFM